MKTNQQFRLTVMEKRLKDIVMLLELWARYVDIIYASETEMNFLGMLKKEGELQGLS